MIKKILNTQGGKRIIIFGGLMIGLILFSWYSKKKEAEAVSSGAGSGVVKTEKPTPPFSKLLSQSPPPPPTNVVAATPEKDKTKELAGAGAWELNSGGNTDSGKVLKAFQPKPPKERENTISTNSDSVSDAPVSAVSLYDATSYYQSKAEKASELLLKYKSILNPNQVLGGLGNRGGGGSDESEITNKISSVKNSVPANWEPAPDALPFGTVVKCVLVSDLESGLPQTPVIGIVEQGIGPIPMNTIIHGTIESALRDRMIVNDAWTLVFPDKREAVIRAKTLTRDNPDGKDQYFGKDNLSFGLKGVIVDERDKNRIYDLLLTGLKSAVPLVQQQQISPPSIYAPLGGSQAAVTTGNAALAALGGMAQSEIERQQKLMDELSVYVHVPAGRQFYLYLQQSFSSEMASPGLGTRYRGRSLDQPIGLGNYQNTNEEPGRLLLSPAAIKAKEDQQDQVNQAWNDRVIAEREEQNQLQNDLQELRRQAHELLKNKEQKNNE